MQVKPSNNNARIAAEKCSKFLADKRIAMAHIAQGGSIDELNKEGIKIAFPVLKA